MTRHYVTWYSLVEEKKEVNYVEIYPCQGKRTRRRMSETHASTEDHYKPGLYEIRLKGHLDARWASRFEGLTITLEDNGDTLLTGPVIDQAALHGLLKKVRDLGLSLVSVRPLEPGPSTTLGTGQADRSDVK
ncbi:hypothetical protein ANRL3_01541 [Anaerolineae bacterium]|nr:hypothetical protein ANRL3_01541 [Anaerolineae bacterium]